MLTNVMCISVPEERDEVFLDIIGVSYCLCGRLPRGVSEIL